MTQLRPNPSPSTPADVILSDDAGYVGLSTRHRTIGPWRSIPQADDYHEHDTVISLSQPTPPHCSLGSTLFGPFTFLLYHTHHFTNHQSCSLRTSSRTTILPPLPPLHSSYYHPPFLLASFASPSPSSGTLSLWLPVHHASNIFPGIPSSRGESRRLYPPFPSYLGATRG